MIIGSVAVVIALAVVAAVVLVAIRLLTSPGRSVPPLAFSTADQQQLSAAETYAQANAQPRAWYVWDVDDESEDRAATLTTTESNADGVLVTTYSAPAPTESGTVDLTPDGKATNTTTVQPAGEAAADDAVAQILSDAAPDDCDLGDAACAILGIATLRSTGEPPAIVADSRLVATIRAMDGVSVLGTTTDHAGRGAIGLGVDVDDQDRQVVVLVQPSTGLILGVDVVDTAADQPTIRSMTVIDPRG